MNKELIEIQAKLKAPKNQHNDFGGYDYRSCEDILEALKPLLKEYGALLYFTGEYSQNTERYYAHANFESESGKITVTESVPVPKERKKMTPEQIAGATISYARKYALNGLFLIDDAKDPDTNEYQKENANMGQKQQSDRPMSNHERVLRQLINIGKSCGYEKTEIGEMAGQRFNKELVDLNKNEIQDICIYVKNHHKEKTA